MKKNMVITIHLLLLFNSFNSILKADAPSCVPQNSTKNIAAITDPNILLQLSNNISQYKASGGTKDYSALDLAVKLRQLELKIDNESKNINTADLAVLTIIMQDIATYTALIGTKPADYPIQDYSNLTKAISAKQLEFKIDKEIQNLDAITDSIILQQILNDISQYKALGGTKDYSFQETTIQNKLSPKIDATGIISNAQIAAGSYQQSSDTIAINIPDESAGSTALFQYLQQIGGTNNQCLSQAQNTINTLQPLKTVQLSADQKNNIQSIFSILSSANQKNKQTMQNIIAALKSISDKSTALKKQADLEYARGQIDSEQQNPYIFLGLNRVDLVNNCKNDNDSNNCAKTTINNAVRSKQQQMQGKPDKHDPTGNSNIYDPTIHPEFDQAYAIIYKIFTLDLDTAIGPQYYQQAVVLQSTFEGIITAIENSIVALKKLWQITP